MGKLSDKFLNAFSLKDNDDDYEDDYDDYDDEEYDENYDDDYNDSYDEPVEEEPRQRETSFSSKAKKAPAREEYRPSPAPAPAPAPARKRSSNQEVCIVKPSTIEDSREITEILLQGKAVVINFEGLHVEISQRIIDFVSGSCYALDGKLQKISNYIFIATPNSIDISGDFQDLLGNTSEESYDMSGFKSPLF